MEMGTGSDFSPHDLYGGMIVADIPSGFIDASNLRQIPDHQELFLSPSTLTSIIFELNEHQGPSTVETYSNIRPSRRASNPQSQDESASTHHLIDPISAPDYLDPESLALTPLKVTLQHSSVASFSAYTQRGTILSPELDRDAAAARGDMDVLPVDWQQDPPKKLSRTKVYQLLVRIPDHETDLCVRVNVPLKEYHHHHHHHHQQQDTQINTEKKLSAISASASSSSSSSSSSATDHKAQAIFLSDDQADKTAAAEKEMRLGEEIIARVVQTLNIKDFGLLGVS